MTSGLRKTGDFCWFNVLTPKPAQAREFFAALLGWTYADMPGEGHLVMVGGHKIGALFDHARPGTPSGMPPTIGVMVKVEDADAIVRRAATLGGRAQPAFDVMHQGRMAVCTDPAGASIDVWQPKQGQGTDVDDRMHGAPTWFETLTSDVAGATKFYTGMFGWKTDEKPMPGFTYTVFVLGEKHVGGLMPILPEMGKMPAHWAIYFAVRNADETARTALKLGGKVHVPVQMIPGIGRFCGILSPQGVSFFVLEYATGA